MVLNVVHLVSCLSYQVLFRADRLRFYKTTKDFVRVRSRLLQHDRYV
jgi:hypothetical protein